MSILARYCCSRPIAVDLCRYRLPAAIVVFVFGTPIAFVTCKVLQRLHVFCHEWGRGLCTMASSSDAHRLVDYLETTSLCLHSVCQVWDLGMCLLAIYAAS